LTFLSSGRREGGYSQPSAPKPDNNMSAMGLDEDFHLMADDDEVPF
jgi:single-strand DNA-binding protein